jgi:hypothetical protein
MTKRQQHRWAIDGLEEGIARVEEDGERMLSVPRHLLPADVREGQVLTVTRGTARNGALQITIAIDEAATQAALEQSKATVTKTMTASRARDPGGDVAL